MTEEELKKIQETTDFSGYDRMDGVIIIRKLLAEISRLRTVSVK